MHKARKNRANVQGPNKGKIVALGMLERQGVVIGEKTNDPLSNDRLPDSGGSGDQDDLRPLQFAEHPLRQRGTRKVKTPPEVRADSSEDTRQDSWYVLRSAVSRYAGPDSVNEVRGAMAIGRLRRLALPQAR